MYSIVSRSIENASFRHAAAMREDGDACGVRSAGGGGVRRGQRARGQLPHARLCRAGREMFCPHARPIASISLDE
jgi:hypothetical protein